MSNDDDDDEEIITPDERTEEKMQEQQPYVSKLFNLQKEKPKLKQTTPEVDVAQLRKQIESEVMMTVQAKVSQLDNQVNLLQKERNRIGNMKTELESKAVKLNEEKLFFNVWKEKEINSFEVWKKEEISKITKARKKSDKNLIDLNCTIKKLKEDNDKLRVELTKNSIDFKDKEIKFKSQIDRNKKTIELLTQKNNELEKGMEMLKERGTDMVRTVVRNNEINKIIKNPDFEELKTKVRGDFDNISTIKKQSKEKKKTVIPKLGHSTTQRDYSGHNDNQHITENTVKNTVGC